MPSSTFKPRRGRRIEYGDHWLRRTNSGKNRDFLLEEYKSLRDEVTASLGAQYTILGFGAATLGFVIAAATQVKNRGEHGMLLLVLFPLLSYLIFTIWITEVFRMMRAGAFVMRLEKRADMQFARGALTWESTLFERRCQNRRLDAMHDPDFLRTIAITLLFAVLAGVSIAMGWHAAHGFAWQHVIPLAAGGFTAVAFGVIWWVRARELDRLLSPLLQNGDMGFAVAELQRKLVSEGFLDSDRVDGKFGAETHRALCAFQESAGLEPDGIAGLMTWTRLDDVKRAHLNATVDAVVARAQREHYVKRCERQLDGVPALRHCELASLDKPGILELVELPDHVVAKVCRSRAGTSARPLLRKLRREFPEKKPLPTERRRRLLRFSS